MTVFETLMVGHIIGDWLLQTEWQALNKASHWRAMASHVAVYHAVIWFVLLLHFDATNPHIYLTIGFLAITHAILDRGWPVRGYMRGLRISVRREPARWLTIAVDQSMHVVLLALAALYLSARA